MQIIHVNMDGCLYSTKATHTYGGDSFAHKFLYFLNSRELVCALLHFEQWKPDCK